MSGAVDWAEVGRNAPLGADVTHLPEVLGEIRALVEEVEDESPRPSGGASRPPARVLLDDAFLREAWERLTSRRDGAHLLGPMAESRRFLALAPLRSLLEDFRIREHLDAKDDAGTVPTSLEMMACLLGARPETWIAAEELALEAGARVAAWWRRKAPVRVAWTLHFPADGHVGFWESLFSKPAYAACSAVGAENSRDRYQAIYDDLERGFRAGPLRQGLSGSGASTARPVRGAMSAMAMEGLWGSSSAAAGRTTAPCRAAQGV